MVIGWLQSEQAGSDRSPVAASAWAQVEAAQRQARVSCLLVPQPAHAVLAGELAHGLTCFGELPPEIKQAIQMHDTGWASSDAQQIQRLRSGGSHAAHAARFIHCHPARGGRRGVDGFDQYGRNVLQAGSDGRQPALHPARPE